MDQAWRIVIIELIVFTIMYTVIAILMYMIFDIAMSYFSTLLGYSFIRFVKIGITRKV